MSTANALGNAARAAYDLAYQQSPIILNGGLFASALGGMAPIQSLLGGLISDVTGGTDLLPTTKFVPVPGATAISNTVATYPFANRFVAGKQATFMALQSTFEAHTAAGGTYHVITPSYPYFDCVMATMTDVTSGGGYQQQIQWQIDFVQPLITQQQAQTAWNGMMSQISGGQQLTTSSWTEAASTAGTPVQGAASAVSGVYPSTR
jgi:hypothetical protein